MGNTTFHMFWLRSAYQEAYSIYGFDTNPILKGWSYAESLTKQTLPDIIIILDELIQEKVAWLSSKQ